MGPIQSDYLDEQLRRNPYAVPPFAQPGMAPMGGMSGVDPGDVPSPDQTSNVPLNYFGQSSMMGAQQQAAPASAPNFGGEPPDVTSPESDASDYAATPTPTSTGSASRTADTDEGEESSDEAQQPSTVNPAATGGTPATPPTSQNANTPASMAAAFPMSEQYKQALQQYANRQPSKLQMVLGAIVGSAFPRVGQLITNPRMAMDQQRIQALSQAASTEQGEARTAALMAEDKARVDLIKQQTQYYGTNSLAAILNHGGEVIPPGGQPPVGKTGSVVDIGGRQVFMPDLAERAKETRAQQMATWPTVTPEMANSPLGKQFGLQPNQKLNPTDWAKFMDAAARGRGLVDVPEDLQDALGGAKQATTDQILAAMRSNKAKAINFGPEVNSELVALGADPANPKPAEMQQALKNVAKQRLAERPNTNINLQMPPQTPQQKTAAETPIPQGQTTNDAFLATLPPEEQAILKAWAQGMRKIPQGSALRDPNIKKWYSDLSIYDPKASEQRFQVRTEFTAPNSKTAGNVRSLNTLTGHLGTLNDMAEALQNNNVQLYNQLANKLITAFGDPRLTNFELAKAAVSTELSSALKGQATEGDIKTWAHQIQNSASPEQIRGYAQTPLTLMKSRLQALNQQWVNAFGQNAPDGLIVYPEAAQTFQKFGVNPGAGGGGGSITFKAPNGKTYNFKNQQGLDAFKKQAGIQ